MDKLIIAAFLLVGCHYIYRGIRYGEYPVLVYGLCIIAALFLGRWQL